MFCQVSFVSTVSGIVIYIVLILFVETSQTKSDSRFR